MAETVSFFFAGDFAPCRDYEKLVIEKKENIFGELQAEISNADLSYLNLETPLTSRGRPILKSGPHLRSTPECIDGVVRAGFDVVGLANNHIMDFGAEGLVDTMAVCHNRGLITCGAGLDLDEAQAPVIITKKDIKIGLVAVAEHEFSIAAKGNPGAAPLDIIDNIHQFQALRKKTDLIFLTIHGGVEYFPFPRPQLRKLCQFYVDNYVDGVFCHHPHLPGAYEIYNGKPIFYSLGNLIFSKPHAPLEWKQGFAVRLEFNCETLVPLSIQLIPYIQDPKLLGIVLLDGEEKRYLLNKLDGYRCDLENVTPWLNHWDNYVRNKMDALTFHHFSPVNFRGAARLAKFIRLSRWYPSRNQKVTKLNLIRCESHLEVSKAALLESL